MRPFTHKPTFPCPAPYLLLAAFLLLHNLLSAHRHIQRALKQTQTALYSRVMSPSPCRGLEGAVLLQGLCSTPLTPLFQGHPPAAGHREQSPPAQASLLCPLRPFAPVPSSRMLARPPATTGLCLQLFCFICSHANCAQRRGDRLQAPRLWVSKVNSPLTAPPWANWQQRASAGLCSVFLSSP